MTFYQLAENLKQSAKFKVGDYVRVISGSSDEESRFIGHIGRVDHVSVYITTDGGIYTIEYKKGFHIGNDWYERELEFVFDKTKLKDQSNLNTANDLLDV